MFKIRSKKARSIVIIVICLVSIALVGSSVAMLANYSGVMHEGAGIIGIVNSNKSADSFRATIDEYREKSENLAETLLSNSFADVDDFSLSLSSMTRDDRFSEIMFMRYFKDGVEYSLNNQEFDEEMESKQVIVGARMNTSFCAGIVEDRQHSISSIAYCIPLKNCIYADCIVLFYPVEPVVGNVKADKKDEVKSRFTAICSSEGEVVSILQNSDFEIERHKNIYEFLKNKINDKSVIDSVRTLIDEGNSDYYEISISHQDYILAVSGIREHGTSPFSVIAIYRTDDIYDAAYSTIRTVLLELALFFLMLIFIAVYFIMNYRASEKRIKTIKENDELLNCPTRIKFERVTGDILHRNTGSNFAIIVVDIRHFDYLTEHIGFEQMINELKQIKEFYTRFLKVEETYGYDSNGRFLLLLHYRDKDSLLTRIEAITSHLSVAKVTGSGERITLSIYGGIYQVDKDAKLTVERMVDMAIQAENAVKFPYDFQSFRIFNEKLHSDQAMNEYIEMNMQDALDKKLFKVFYQPKLNLHTSSPDGCEALVRWYNPQTEEYMQPALFLPLFEENRFIIKLDKYVYEQVCIYISAKAAQHEPLYPVSVNVSRITASEPDFLDYYIATKNKYNIMDGFLTIEFTESFAFEDYGQLRETVNVLHSNGFKCSIDDFGSGFSSYNILKELPMDEIKLDRFFIEKGFSDERDFKVLSSVIQLGCGLKMKVTQEGVETKDQMDMLKKLGCNVIQGFYYSRPLVEHDYDDFLKRKFMK
ncbi:MAG: GGDEF domain-containing protein [Clostridia bacterium]|nr:GGDEF domain-containing protein [Clostridia bacterium]